MNKNYFLYLFCICWYQILYKSRCDSRLNEITERVSGDKREVSLQVMQIYCVFHIVCYLSGPMEELVFQVELLAKKYEEKYKQSGDVASKLTLEEATFRDIQVLLVY